VRQAIPAVHVLGGKIRGHFNRIVVKDILKTIMTVTARRPESQL
jgi:hypothetical protein